VARVAGVTRATVVERKEGQMPRILVTTEPIDKPHAGVMLDERVATSDLASEHFATQLIERIGWALIDAEHTEHQPLQRRGQTGEGALSEMFGPAALEPYARAGANPPG
jgi:hypothetical protein